MIVDGEWLGTLLVLPASRRVARFVTPLVRDDAQPPASSALDAMVYRHDSMQQVVRRVRQLADAHTPVLLQGETGTGKEAFARSLHGSRTGAYVTLNCGGLARELLASELFGYVEGAFTGARKGGMAGKIEAAEGGTLFLDEIGEMPLDMQPMLLRVLEQGEVWRLGENAPRRVNFRLIAATHRNLREEVTAGRFRMDLYYRIAVATLRIPPLRERGDDILLLALHYLKQFRRQAGQAAEAVLSDDVAFCLRAYGWPGNVRELRNVMELAVLSSEGNVIRTDMLPEELRQGQRNGEALWSEANATSPSNTLNLHENEAVLIQRAIDAAHGNLSQAARILQIAKSTLYAKIKLHGLRRSSGFPQ